MHQYCGQIGMADDREIEKVNKDSLLLKHCQQA